MLQSETEASPKELGTGQARKRVKRACDKCSRSKARCNGGQPCQHCEDYGYSCTYTRQTKKRGRRSEPNSHSAAVDSFKLSSQRHNYAAERVDPENIHLDDDSAGGRRPDSAGLEPGREAGDGTMAQSTEASPISLYETAAIQATPIAQANMPGGHMSEIALAEEHNLHNFQFPEDMTQEMTHPDTCHLWDLAAELDPPTGNHLDAVYSIPNGFQTPTIQSTRLVSHSHCQLPRFVASITPSIHDPADPESLPSLEKTPATLSTSNIHSRYNILSPLVPYLKSFIPIDDACDLLDLYFTEPSNSLFGCASPYVITQIFRKDSFLKRNPPRKTSKALLAAMLWVTAQCSDSPIFTDDPRARLLICDKLYSLCLQFLRSSKSKDADDTGPEETQNPNDSSRMGNVPSKTLDDVLTYSLIGLVISSRESRKDSLAWFNKAWSLAKELNLNRELDVNLEYSNDPPITTPGLDHNLVIEEIKEERRRVWWLLYIADRHLALSYNSPLKILDADCHVYQPLDDAVWQHLEDRLKEGLPSRYPGPSTTMMGVGIFEFFLPLTAILGDIIDIHHQRFHPRLGLLNRNAEVMQIEQSLTIYETSLKSFEESVILRFPEIGHPLSYSSPQEIFNAYRDIRPWSPEETRLKTVIGYSNYLLHVLYILLHGNWDPLSMLGGTCPWVMPQSFANCATRSILAATAVSEILKVDPELSFMPYLFGIYLLHGSFVLLIFADRMDMATSDTIGRACETMIRAHEVCVTTLNTEYQRTFRKVLRSALNNVRGTVTADMGQHKDRQREFLRRYRWNRGGTGLAI